MYVRCVDIRCGLTFGKDFYVFEADISPCGCYRLYDIYQPLKNYSWICPKCNQEYETDKEWYEADNFLTIPQFHIFQDLLLQAHELQRENN